MFFFGNNMKESARSDFPGRLFFAAILFFVLLSSISLPTPAQAMPDEFAEATPFGSISKQWGCFYQMNTWHTCPKKIVAGRWLLEPAIPEPTLFATAEFEIDEPGRIFLHGSAQCDNCTQLDYSLQKWNGQRWMDVATESGNLVTVCRTGESCPEKEYPNLDALPHVDQGIYRLRAHTGISLAGSGWTFYPETEIDITASFIPDKSSSAEKISILTVTGDNAEVAPVGNDTEKVRCSPGMELKPNSLITTGIDTEIIIDLGGQGLIRLGPSSRFKVEHFFVSADMISATTSLEVGELNCRVSPPAAGTIDFSITTPTCTVGVLGTEFGLRYDQRFRATEIQVASGNISATCPDTPGEKRIRAGQWTVIDSDCNVNNGMMSTSEIIALAKAFPPRATATTPSQGQEPPSAALTAGTETTVGAGPSSEFQEPAQPEPPPLPDISGTWRLTQENGYPGTLVIEKQEEKIVSGTLSWDNFATAPVTGTLQDDVLELVADYGSGLTGTYRATLSPDEKELLKGITSTITGETISWSGVRQESTRIE